MGLRQISCSLKKEVKFQSFFDLFDLKRFVRFLREAHSILVAYGEKSKGHCFSVALWARNLSNLFKSFKYFYLFDLFDLNRFVRFLREAHSNFTRTSIRKCHGISLPFSLFLRSESAKCQLSAKMEKGYITLPRSFFHSEEWLHPRVFSKAEAWLDILASVRFSSQPTTITIAGKTVAWQKDCWPVSRRKDRCLAERLLARITARPCPPMAVDHQRRALLPHTAVRKWSHQSSDNRRHHHHPGHRQGAGTQYRRCLRNG